MSNSTPNNPLPACPDSPNCDRDYIETSLPALDSIENAVSVLKKMGMHKMEVLKKEFRINSVFKIPVFGWLDDFTLLVEESDGKSYIFVRSSSRVGYSDLGVNRRRIEKFKKLFKQSITQTQNS